MKPNHPPITGVMMLRGAHNTPAGAPGPQEEGRSVIIPFSAAFLGLLLLNTYDDLIKLQSFAKHSECFCKQGSGLIAE